MSVPSLRRYAPFALLVMAQIVLVIVAPSRSAPAANGPLGGQFNGAPAPGASPSAGAAPIDNGGGGGGATLGGGSGSAPTGSTGTTTPVTTGTGTSGGSTAKQV